MENFIPLLIMIVLYVGVIYLKKINPLYSIVLLASAIVILLLTTIVIRENVYLSLFMSFFGLIFLIKKIRERNSNLNAKQN